MHNHGAMLLCGMLFAGCFYSNGGDDYHGGGGGGGGNRPDAFTVDAGPPCTPLSCSDVGASCGAVQGDGCGHVLACGDCSGAAMCGGQGQPNVCAIPAAQRQCVNGWCWEAPAPFGTNVIDMFARSATDVWAVGGPLVQHWDGIAWSFVDVPSTVDLYAVWMASATDGWIVGEAGTALHWNGTAWASVATGATVALTGVHGSAANNVWIVGQGVSKKWNGATLVAGAASTPALDRVYVAANHVFAIGPEASVYENVAGAWVSRVGSEDGAYFAAIAGNAAGTSVFAVGGDDPGFLQDDIDWVYRFDGSTWSRVDEPGNGEYWDAFSDGTNVFASTEKDVWTMASMAEQSGPGIAMRGPIAGAGGDLFTWYAGPYHYHAGSWAPPPPVFVAAARGDALHAGAAIGGEMWFADGAGVLEWNHGAVEHGEVGPESYVGVTAVAGTARSDVWALDSGHLAYHFDGTQWSQVDGGGLFAGAGLAGAYADPALTLLYGTKVFRVAPPATGQGSGSGSAMPDGGTAAPAPFVEETLPATATWAAAAPIGATGGVILVGNDLTTSTPRVLTRAAATGAWTALTAPGMTTVCAVAARAANDIWVSGYDPDGLDRAGAIAHWNGAKWTVQNPIGGGWCSLAMSSTGDAWAAGPSTSQPNGGYVYHLVGSAWQPVRAVYTGEARTVVFDATDVLWVGGDGGSLLHR